MLFLYNLNASKKWVAAYLGRILNDESQACGTTTARINISHSCDQLCLPVNCKACRAPQHSHTLSFFMRMKILSQIHLEQFKYLT